MAQPMLSPQVAPVCAACYSQNPDREHIDYRSAIEGRLVDPSKPRGGHVDWVVICEDCLRAGLELLPEQRNKREADQATIAALRAELAGERAAVDALRAAVAAVPPREHAHPTVTPVEPHRPGRGSLAGAPVAKPRRTRYSPKGQA